MRDIDTQTERRGGRLFMPRSRGAASGLLLIVLGAWGAAAPFVGTHVDFAFSPGHEWTAAKGWLEVLPGAAALIGGCLLAASRNRATAMLGGCLSVLAGAWFVVGRAVAGPLGLGVVGTPVASTDTERLLLDLAYFSGLGAALVFLGAVALGRLSVRSFRDVERANRPVEAAVPPTERVAVPTGPSTARRRLTVPFGRRGSHAL
jgi:hypothetical protein